MCAKVYKRAQDLKAHKTRAKHHVEEMIKVSGQARKEAKRKKMEEVQEKLPVVMWGDKPADNCWKFQYLGAIFTPDTN